MIQIKKIWRFPQLPCNQYLKQYRENLL